MTRISFLIVFVAFAASSAAAQTAAIRAYVGDVVIDRDGRPNPPWIQHKACYGKTEKECGLVTYNPKTKEFAGLDGKWSTGFEATGNGSEVRRAESALATAKRLHPDAPVKVLPAIAAPHEPRQLDPKYGPSPNVPPRN